ncbi:MAG: hypothetical protein NUW08_01560, partial [Candidatus Uhrbacteria bacterium]|nr:hypothetical protein [Candidatus Uhrbacteria bacterium]
MSPYLSFPVPQAKSVRTLGLFAVAFVSLFFLSGLFSRPASAAAPCVFRATQNSDFVNIGNWTCGHTPTLGDDVWISAATTVNMNATSSILVQNISVSGTLNVAGGTIQSTSTVTIISGGSVSSTNGVMHFNTVTSTGSFGTVTGGINVTSTFQNNGWFNIQDGGATTTGSLTNA